MMALAVGTRETNTKTKYLRAFCHLLLTTYQISLETAPIKKAIAEITNVVIDDHNEITTYDDVRKIVDALKKNHSDDFSKKEPISISEPIEITWAHGDIIGTVAATKK